MKHELPHPDLIQAEFFRLVREDLSQKLHAQIDPIVDAHINAAVRAATKRLETELKAMTYDYGRELHLILNVNGVPQEPDEQAAD